MAAQLAFDVAPAGGVAVGDRVRVLAGPAFGVLRLCESDSMVDEMTGTVVEVRPTEMPRPGGYLSYLPVGVAIDDLDRAVYYFRHERLAMLGGDA